MKTRRFKDGACNHIYQRTINRYNIFYGMIYYLVYYTIFCTLAKKYDVIVWGLCLMIDHIHMLVTANLKETLSAFVSNVTSVFVREYNASVGRTGPLFEERFGSAPKIDRKKMMSAIIYLGNNPVEKHICSRAEEFRWNFIAYINSTHPYSDKIYRRHASFRLRKAISIVEWHYECGRYLNYKVLSEMMKGLTLNEKNQLADYIIVKYNVICKENLLRTFGSYNDLLTSMHSTMGSEYDLKEHVDRLPDSAYKDMIRYLHKRFGDDVRKVTVCSISEKVMIAESLRTQTSSAPSQILKFLHLNPADCLVLI